MKRTQVGMVVLIVGVIILAAGFFPLTRKVIVTEEKTMETIEYKEETRTREESYYEEEVVGTETKKEVLLEEEVPVVRASTLGKTFELKEGDVIQFEAHADDVMMISFTGLGDMYMSLELGKDIEKEFTIRKTGEHTLLYSSASVTVDIVIDFYIARIYEEEIVEQVEKTRTAEYTERVPYTVETPYTEQTAKKEQYTLDYLRYAGIVIILLGGAIYILSRKPQSSKRKKKKK
jgi:hypothetical protein